MPLTAFYRGRIHIMQNCVYRFDPALHSIYRFFMLPHWKNYCPTLV